MKSTEAEAGVEQAAIVEADGRVLELREMVREASAALARLDADRLEELARSCQVLNRDGSRDAARAGHRGGGNQAVQARGVAGDFAVFTRVLEATRANLDVMRRLRTIGNGNGDGELEYGGRNSEGLRWARPETNPAEHQEASDGNN